MTVVRYESNIRNVVSGRCSLLALYVFCYVITRFGLTLLTFYTSPNMLRYDTFSGDISADCVFVYYQFCLINFVGYENQMLEIKLHQHQRGYLTYLLRLLAKGQHSNIRRRHVMGQHRNIMERHSNIKRLHCNVNRLHRNLSNIEPQRSIIKWQHSKRKQQQRNSKQQQSKIKQQQRNIKQQYSNIKWKHSHIKWLCDEWRRQRTSDLRALCSKHMGFGIIRHHTYFFLHTTWDDAFKWILQIVCLC